MLGSREEVVDEVEVVVALVMVIVELDAVVVDKLVELVLKDEVVEIMLEDEPVEAVLVDEVVDVVDDEPAARLLYIFKAFEPPQYSSGFPIQVLVQAVDPTTLPALGELPQ